MIDIMKKYTSSLSASYWFLAAVLAFFYTGSLYFYNGGDAIVARTPYTYVFVCLIHFSFCMFIFVALIVFLRAVLAKAYKLFDCEEVANNNKDNKWLAYIILFWGWLPNLIVKYPGAMCWDTWRMLHNYRKGFLDAHHSALYSLVVGKCIQFFDSIGHVNWGLLFIVTGQYLLSVFVFGYSIQLFRRMKLRKEVIWLIVAFYLLCPYIISYLGVAIKDAPYSVLILLLTVLLIEFSWQPSEFYRSGFRLFLLFFSILVSCLLRKNGIIIIGLSSLFFLPAIIRKKREEQVFIPFAVIVISCLSVFAVKELINIGYEVRPGYIAEALSLPFQQTARYVKYYEKEVTDEECVAIDEVLIYKTLASRYMPMISDPVKDEYLKDDTKLPAYFKVWIKQFFRHPLCYVAATWEQNFYFFVPEIEFKNVALYLDYETVFECGGVYLISDGWKYYENIFDRDPALVQWTSWAIKVYNQLHKPFPVGLISNISINTYLLFLLFSLMFLEKKNWQYVFPLMLLHVFCVVVGPVIQGQPRYMFPVLYSMPSLIVYTLFSFKEEPIEEWQEESALTKGESGKNLQTVKDKI